MGSVVDRVVDHTHAFPPQVPLSFAEATQRGLGVLFDTDSPINDDGPGGLKITDSGQNRTTALAGDVPNIIDEDRSDQKINNDDGHHDATKVVTGDLKIISMMKATVVRRSPMRIIAILLLRLVLLLLRMFQVPTIPNGSNR